MSDAKTKLAQVKPYEHDASKFKGELKAQLMQEYRKKYGIEEVFEREEPKQPWFSLPKFVLTPVMAVLVLAVFIGYEYVSQPMTAYAYLKEVEKRHKELKKSGVKVRTTHTINGYELEVESMKDEDGNFQVAVFTDGYEVEHFVMEDGVLYVKDEAGTSELVGEETTEEDIALKNEMLKAERAEDLNSIMTSMVFADLADPQDEWMELLERDDVEFTESEDGLVHLSYEELVDGEIFVNELQFRDFEPVRRVRGRKSHKKASALIAEADEVIEYHEVAPLKEKVRRPGAYVVFVENTEFNEKITSFVDEEVDDLVTEYVQLPEKDPYFRVWNDRKKELRQKALIAREVSIEEISPGGLTEREAMLEEEINEESLPERAIVMDVELPESAASRSDVVVPRLTEREGDVIVPEPRSDVVHEVEVIPTVLPPRELPEIPIEDLPERDFADAPGFVSPGLKESTPLIRDAYLEEVFYDLLEDKEEDHEANKDEEKDDENVDEKTSEKDHDVNSDVDIEIVKPVPGVSTTPVVEPVPRDVDLPKVKVPTVKDTSDIVLPTVERDTEHLRDEHGVTDADRDALIDTSIPEPYMSEPIDPVIVPRIDTSETTHKESGTSYTDLLEKRKELQDHAAEERLRVRMEHDTKELEIKERVVVPDEPHDEFEKGQ